MSLHPIYVLEGPDGVGKTTLSEALCKAVRGRYIHLTYRWKDRMNLYHGAALSFALKVARKQPVVIDRWWPTEVVYADAYRGGTPWPYLGRALDRVAQAHGVTYIFCLPQDRMKYLQHYSDLKARRHEMYNDGMERVYDNFDALYHYRMMARPNVWRYDFLRQGHVLDHVVQALIELSQDEKAALPGYSRDPDFTNLSGNVSYAKHLIVGDTPVRKGVYPFADIKGGYSETLSVGLDMSSIQEHRLAYMNVDFPENQKLTDHVIHECVNRRMKVLALGNNASRSLGIMGVKHEKIAHPREGWDTDVYTQLERILR